MILSIIIVVFILMGVIIGIKRGFTYQLIKMLSTIVVLILALLLKNIVAAIFVKYFNFIDLDPSISILFYRGISFIILCFILKLLIRFLLKLSKNFENFLNKTIILGIPSKILGGVLGFVEYYIYTMIILVILSIPVFNINIQSSGVAKSILKNIPKISTLDISLITDMREVADKCNKDCEEEYRNILKKYKLIKKSN